MADELDLAGYEINQDPVGVTRRVLADGEIQWSDRHRGWLYLSHRQVSAGFRDQRLSADRIGPLQRLAAEKPDQFGQAVELLSGWMIFRDPPAHTHLRDPVRRALTPRIVDGLRTDIESTVDALLTDLEAEVADKGAGGRRLDFRVGFAEPLPALVIAALLGVPGSDRHRFKDWSDGLAEIVFSVQPNSVPGDTVGRAVADFTAFFTELIDHRRRHPGDDLVSQMVAGGADTLTTMELVGACTLLLFAGHETTTNMLVSAVQLLHHHPELKDRIVHDPTIEVTGPDELLRVAGPAKTMIRRVGPQPFEVDGQRLSPGEKVFLVILTANHDPAAVDQPERIDLGRDPNPHLGFGWGLHHCLGAPLARMELAVALPQLYRTFPELAPAEPDRPWSGNELGRGLGRMHVTV